MVVYQKKESSMKSSIKRLITSAVLIAVLIPAIYFGGIFFLAISMFIGMIGSFELMDMFYKKSPTLKWLRFVIPIFSGLMIFAMYAGINLYQPNGSYFFTFDGNKIITTCENMDITNIIPSLGNGLTLVVAIFMVGVLFSFGSCIFIHDSTAHDIMSCVISLVYGGLMVGFATTLEYIPPLLAGTTQIKHVPGRMLGYVYSVAVATDVFAYLIGSKFGKHRLCVHISPKKSVEGAIGGLVFGGVLGSLFGFLFKVMPVSSSFSGGTNFAIVVLFFIMSLILSFFVQLGDLVASKLKRTYEIKDYGNIFPGHGGVMDRFDSFIYSGCIFFIIVQIFQMIILGVI